MNRSTLMLTRLSFSVVLLACCAPVIAAPTLNNISLRGLQIGGTTTLVFDGGDLLPEPKILASFPIAKQVVAVGGSAGRVQIEVTLDDSVSPGIYQLRLANAKGVSNPVAIGIDRLPQLPFAPQATALPVALHGSVNGSEIQRVSFSGKKDERIVIDLESRRLGSNLKPILRVYDERGRQIAWSPQLGSIMGDARCNMSLPADGAYTIELHDLLYRAAAPSFYRLKIGSLTYADQAFPVGIRQGAKAALQFAGTNLPADAKAEFDPAGPGSLPLDRPAPIPALLNFTGSAPRIVVSSFPELVESSPAEGQLQTIDQFPAAMNGRLSAAGEEDKYLLNVAPGAKLRFDVLARRLGSPVDGVLSVRGEKGEQPVSNDDRPGQADPGLDYTVPGNVSKLIISLRDLNGRGGPDSVYRIAVTDLARPDFSLALETDRLNVPAGGTQVVKVLVDRQGYNGPIKLDVSPMSLALAGQEIPAGATIGLLTLSAPAGVPQSMLASIVGTGLEGQSAIVKTARSPESAVSRRQPWLRDELGLAVTEPAPLNVAWVPAADEKLLQGGKLPVKLQFTRAQGVAGAIRVRLLTTQIMPKKKIKENNADKVVDDVDRALRLEGDPVFAAEVGEGLANILVPADLPNNPWGLVVSAELLAADGKTVVYSAAAPARLLPVELKK